MAPRRRQATPSRLPLIVWPTLTCPSGLCPALILLWFGGGDTEFAILDRRTTITALALGFFLPLLLGHLYGRPESITSNRSATVMQLYDSAGHRKYLTPSERDQFLRAAASAPPRVQTFCGVLAYSGCRISEALALTADRVDFGDGVLIFESLKKRRRGVFRAVPAHPHFLEMLARVHNLPAARPPDVRLWPWSRSTGWRHVRAVMQTAGIHGTQASPKGLRHGFGIKAVISGVPLHMVQKWMGHTQLATTAIYAAATGPEEKQLAARMWS